MSIDMPKSVTVVAVVYDGGKIMPPHTMTCAGGNDQHFGGADMNDVTRYGPA